MVLDGRWLGTRITYQYVEGGVVVSWCCKSRMMGKKQHACDYNVYSGINVKR